MDDSSWAPFTPPFSDQPMAMDEALSVQPNDWQQNDWAPSYFDEPGNQLISRFGMTTTMEHSHFSFAGGNFDMCPKPAAVNSLDYTLISDFTDTNTFADVGFLPTESLDRMFPCITPPARPANINEHIADAVSYSTPLPMGASSQSPCQTLNKALTSTPSAHDRAQHDGTELRRLADFQYLADLPESVLKELSKNVAEALIIAKHKTKEESPQHGEETATLPLEMRQPQIISDAISCGHKGCKINFRRNKDRLRHIREKHAAVIARFSCPVIDCSMGYGHKFHRADKLRDHLRGEKIACHQWSCVIPGCLEIAATRSALINHLGQHDLDTRRANFRLLRDYELGPRSREGYFQSRYICNVEGCPFGSDDECTMSSHRSIPHEGPLCPCPIPTCNATFKDWLSVGSHIARAHDFITRKSFDEVIRSQKHYYNACHIVCPICQDEIMNAYTSQFRDHCQTHRYQELLQASDRLLSAWVFAFGTKESLGSHRLKHPDGEYYWETITPEDNKILAYLISPDDEFKNLLRNPDFEEAGAKLRAAINLISKNGQHS